MHVTFDLRNREDNALRTQQQGSNLKQSCMRPALPGVLYENLALMTGHCMEYTLACIPVWCYYYDDGLECLYTAVLASPVHFVECIATQV